jgi:hypothetical protein
MILNLFLAGNKGKKGSRAFAMLEYVMLLLILAIALVSFRGYLQRAFQGQYRKVGESFGFLRQYNPRNSLDCVFEPATGVWYSSACFNNKILADKCAYLSADDYKKCVYTAKIQCRTGCAMEAYEEPK